MIIPRVLSASLRHSFLGVLVVFLPLVPTFGQAPPDPTFERQRIFASYDEFLTDLNTTAAIADPARRTERLDHFFERLEGAGQVPFAFGDRVAFLYRGSGTSLRFPGDHNGWSTNPALSGATRIGSSDVWIREEQHPANARIDYKVVRDGSWILDPRNPLQMWSGFGPNSELRMPRYAYPTETVPQVGQSNGTLGANQLISSTHLGYDIHYRVYTPAALAPGVRFVPLSVIYFTDGHEYLANHMGGAVTVLDNLIAAGTIKRSMAVFIDPRDPVTGQNKRSQQYVGNPDFADFVALELAPAIDAQHATNETAEGRTICGTSLGGLFSAYLGARHSVLFGNLAIQSPAFQVYPTIYSSFTGNTALAGALDIYMENGTINDGSGATVLNGILSAGNYDFVFEEVNEGHSWGHWRGKLDDAFVNLIGAP